MSESKHEIAGDEIITAEEAARITHRAREKIIRAVEAGEIAGTVGHGRAPTILSAKSLLEWVKRGGSDD